MTTTVAPPSPAGPGVGGSDVPVGSHEGPSPAVGRVLGVVLVVAALALVATGVIAPAAVVFSLPFLWLLFRRPVVRRLAVRNAVRRPRETALVLIGALLGTAIVTSANVVGDTLNSSIRRIAYTELGPIDHELLANDAATAARAQQAIINARVIPLDSVLPIVALTASISTPGPSPKAQPHGQLLETDFGAARALGGNPSATGISGPNPVGDEAVAGRDLANSIGITPGDSVVVYAYGTSRTFHVSRILPKLGVAGLGGLNSFQSNLSPNLFVAPGTIEALRQAGTVTQAAPPTWMLAVTTRLGVVGGVTVSDHVKAQLEQATRGITVRVLDVKKGLLDAANKAGKQFTQFFQQFGYFSVLAGILLLINIFVMLAQERKQTLGMLRAIGLRRGSLVASFSLEGWMYALGAAAVGTLAGLGVGRMVVVLASRAFNSGTKKGEGLTLNFAATLRSVQSGFLVGFLIALVTVVIASLYVARLNVIRAIRDLPEPPATGRRLGRLIAGVVVAIAGAGLTLAGIAGDSAVPTLIGPALLGLGITAVLRRVPARPKVTVISILVLLWEVFAFSLLHGAFRKAGIISFVVQGIVMTGYAVALITENQELIGSTIKAVGGGSRNMSLRLGLAYPLAKRFRTGLTLAMYSIVVFFLVALSTFSHLFSKQADDFTRKLGGKAAIVVQSNPASPVPAADVAHLPGVTAVSAASEDLASFAYPGKTKPADEEVIDVVGFDQSFIDHVLPPLHTRQAAYPTDADAYRAALADPSKIIVSQEFLSQRNGPPGPAPTLGSLTRMRDEASGRTRDFTIIALVDQASVGRLDHVFVSHTAAASVFGPKATPSLLYVGTAPGTDNEALTVSINGRYIANGADANSFRHLVSQALSAQLQFFILIKGYVGLGLLVGIAGLGVVMVRAVRERRREIGVLRSLGFSGVAVRRAFMAESSFVALEGIGIGAALGLITVWRVINANAFGSGLSFSVPWTELTVLVVGTFVASLIATAIPAVQASRIRPAVALRIAD